MSTLVLTARRSLKAHAATCVGLALVTALVSASILGGTEALRLLETARDGWSKDLRLADLELRFDPVARGLAERARGVAGVLDAEERLLAEGSLTLASGRRVRAVVHVLPDGAAPTLSSWRALEGRLPP